MRYASVKSQEMKAPFINNLPMPTNDVMVNPIHPENPDSKPVAAAHIISTDDRVSSPRFKHNCLFVYAYYRVNSQGHSPTIFVTLHRRRVIMF